MLITTKDSGVISINPNELNKEFILDVISEERKTYKQFFQDSLVLKNYLNINSKEDIENYIVITPNSYKVLVLYTAILLLNKTVVPIDSEKALSEITSIIKMVPKSDIICDEAFFDLIESNNTKHNLNEIYQNSSDEMNEAFILEAIDNINYEKVFLITFTSGSTGMPKGVKHSFGNLVKSAKSFSDQFNFGYKHTFYHNLPMSYMAGILNTFILPLVSNCKIVVDERFSFKNSLDFWRNPIKFKINVFWFTPTILSMILKVDRTDIAINYFKNNKIIGLVGTAPLPKVTQENFEGKYKIDLYQSYGLSEYLFISTNHKNFKECYSVGEILNGVSIDFEKDKEIYVKTDWDFLGYLDEETVTINKHGFYATGDIGEIACDRYLYITDRKKDIIIRGGINISPKRIEKLIESTLNLNEFIIIGIDDSIIGEKTVCFYSDDKRMISSEDRINLKKIIIENLGKNYLVDEYIKMDFIPKNINGKVDKFELKKHYKRIVNNDSRD